MKDIRYTLHDIMISWLQTSANHLYNFDIPMPKVEQRVLYDIGIHMYVYIYIYVLFVYVLFVYVLFVYVRATDKIS